MSLALKRRLRRTVARALVVIFSVLLGHGAFAAPPANDNFANAQTISNTGTSGSVTGDNTNATHETSEPSHAGDNPMVSVWFKWTAPSTSTYSFDTFGSALLPRLAIYTGTGLSNLVTQAEATCNSTEFPGYVSGIRARLAATSGTTYYIAIDGVSLFTSNDTDTFVLNWFLSPANDDFVSAQTISTGAGTVTGTSVKSTRQTGEPFHAGVHPYASVWYKWTAPSTYTATIDTIGSSFDTALGVYTGSSISALTSVASNNDISAGNHQSSVTFATVAGTSYYIAVSNGLLDTAGAGGSVNLHWSAMFVVPGAPAFDLITSSSVRSTAPALDTGTTWNLERANGAVAFTAPSTTGMLLWLKADSVTGLATATPLSQWSDSSGHGNNATQGDATAKPLWIQNGPNGRPVIRFDGVNDFLSLPPGFSDFSAGLSAFIVTLPTMTSTDSRLFDLGNGAPGDNINFYRNGGTDSARYTVYTGSNNNLASFNIPGLLSESRWQTLSLVQAANGSSAAYRDGASAGTGSVLVPRVIERSLNYIGKSSWTTGGPGSDSFFSGDIAEILIFNSAQSDSQRIAIESYLAAKYGTPIASSLGLTWTGVATGQTTGSQANDTGLASAQTYWYRYSVPSTQGQAAAATTAPAAPGLPVQFKNVTSSSLSVVAPSLPTGAGSLTLQRKKHVDATYDSSKDITGIAGGAETFEYGLAASTSYDFRYVAVGANGSTVGTAGSASTLAQPTGVPGPPTFIQIMTGSVKVQAPELPTGIVTLKLQMKRSGDVDSLYDDKAIGLGANDVSLVTTIGSGPILPSSHYSFRYVGVKADTTLVPGVAADAVTPGPGVVAPGQATFTNITSTGVTVIAPPLPTVSITPSPIAAATSLRLEERDPGVGTYTLIADNLAGGAQTDVTYTTGGRNHYFRFVAVGPGESVPGLERAPTTIPLAPSAIAGSVTAQGVNFNVQSSTGTNWADPDFLWEGRPITFILQRKLSTDPISAFTDCYYEYSLDGSMDGTGGVVPVGSLAPGKAFDFRWVVASQDRTGTATGPSVSVTTLAGTQPDTPGLPTFTNLGPNSVRVIAPSATLASLRAGSLKLQQLAGMTWSDVSGATSVTPGATTDVTGLTPLTAYSFRYVAVAASGSPPATTFGASAGVTTTANAPETPGTPAIGTSTGTQIDVTLPAIAEPWRTASLTLQGKLSQGTADFVDIPTVQVPGNTLFHVGTIGGTALAAGRSYQFRVKAHKVGDAANVAYGLISGAATTAGPPSAPGAPVVSVWDGMTVKVVAPAALPANADVLTLQVLNLNMGTAITDVQTLIDPNEVSYVGGLTPNGIYRFRYTAVGSGGSTAGPSAADVTMPAPGNPWASAPSLDTQILCNGIRIPIGPTISVARGASLPLQSYLATDWDRRTQTTYVDGVSHDVTMYYSDPCIYQWTAKDGAGTDAGTFVNGVSRAQSATWTAPAMPGTYTVKLTITDQTGLNKATADTGTRKDQDDDPDVPLVFTLTVTVP